MLLANILSLPIAGRVRKTEHLYPIEKPVPLCKNIFEIQCPPEGTFSS